jgi:hypothetical protein
MFVRRKVNKSGSISVHVVDKARGKYRVVKVFGPVESEQEVARLERQARTYIREAGGGVDLFPDEADGSIEDFLSSVSNTQVQVAGPELIFGRLYDRIGYGEIEEEMFRHLVICRLFNPGSKLRTVDYLRRYLGVSYEVGRIYRFLDRLCAKGTDGAEGIKHQVEDVSFRHTREVVGGSIKVAFYDMTTLYFEAAEEDSLRIPGFNKDGKHSCPQIFLGLLVAAQGNPIGYEIYEGNIFEGHTLIPMIEGLAARHGFSHPVVVADAGLLSKKNIQALEEQNYQYILGARPKNESDSIKDRIIGLNLKNGDVKVLDKGGGRRLVVSKTERREHKDAEMDVIKYLIQYKNADDEKIQKTIRGAIMVKMNILKQISAKGKVQGAIDIIHNTIDGGQKLIVFCFLKEVVAELKREFRDAVTVTGDDNDKQKQWAVDRFQTDDACRLIILNYRSGGTGLTLTAASNVLFVEFDWTYAGCCQAEDRAHRNGQKNAVNCVYLLGKDTIDEYMYNMIQTKKDIANGVTGTDEEIAERKISQQDLIFNAAMDIFGKNL